MKTLLAAAPLAVLLSSCLLVVNVDEDEFDHVEPRDAVISSSGIARVRIDGDAGELRVEGLAGLDEVRVHGTAAATRTRLLDDIELHVFRSQGEVVITTAVPPTGARLDLVIQVPEHLAVYIDDDSGDILVTRVGPVDLIDGSGDVRITDVQGDVYVRDGSGDVEIYDVNGNVEVGEDGSGNLFIAHIRGNVRIREDGSGDIDVSDIDGDFTLDRDGSGDVRYGDIGGTVRLPH